LNAEYNLRRLSVTIEEIANTLSPKSSRLAHLYGLPQTQKATLSMKPILSATRTYNYKLAKWLEEKFGVQFE